MQHRNGDLFTTDAKIIAHGANTVGVMGAGIAKTIKDKFPRNFEYYNQFCRYRLAVPGESFAVEEGNVLIVNLFSQRNPGADARYGWVAASLFDFAHTYIQHYNVFSIYGSIVAIPEIGSGIGGLEWPKVQSILESVEKVYPEIEFEVWHRV